jgi:hypothetical protein
VTGVGPTCAEFSNSKTCNGASATLGSGDLVGIVSWNGTAPIDGPFGGASATCNCTTPELADINVTVGLREVLPDPLSWAGGCRCADGYLGATCGECDPVSHETHAPKDGSRTVTCTPKQGVKRCPDGEYFKFDGQAGECTVCPPSTYSDASLDSGVRIECTPCPDAVVGEARDIKQTSALGATSAEQCFPKYQFGAESAEFCYGTGVQSKAILQIPALSEKPDEGERLGDACKTAVENLGLVFDGVHAPLRGCFANHEAQLGYYFLMDADRVSTRARAKRTSLADGEQPRPAPLAVAAGAMKPVCEQYTCAVEGTAISPLSESSNPVVDFSNIQTKCAISAAAVDQALDDEFETNSKVFFPIAAAIIFVSVVLGYVYLSRMHYHDSCCKLPTNAHVWVFFGLALRLFDVMSDFAFLQVTLESVAFEAAAGSRARVIRQVCLGFTVVGAVGAPMDMWGSLQRLSPTGNRDTAGWITVLITLIEDVPQLAINGVYIVIMDRFRETSAGANVEPFDAIAVVSLVASAGNIVYNLWLLFSTYRRELLGLRAEMAELRTTSQGGKSDRFGASAIVLGVGAL